MSGKENKLQRDCIKWCKKHDILAVNIHGGGWCNKGFPDLLIFNNSKTIAVELKNGTDYKQQPIQLMWQKKFEDVRVPYYLITSFDNFTRTIESELI